MLKNYEVIFLGNQEVIHHPDVEAIAATHKGWVAGPYVEGLADIPFEVKEGVHQSGEERNVYSEPIGGYTWARVLTGSITIFFKTVHGEKSVTMTAGASISHSNQIPHRWIVNADNTRVLTVRTGLSVQHSEL